MREQSTAYLFLLYDFLFSFLFLKFLRAIFIVL